MTKLLICDAYNLMHRARSGFALGPAPVIFNFFRGFKSLVEKQKPDKVVFVLEGHPKQRLSMYPEYKANRIVNEDDPKFLELQKFHEQKDIIINLLKERFPVSVIRHSDYEADDVIYTLVKNASKCVDVTVVSSDTDFTQLLDEFENVSIFNPIKKEYLAKHTCDYVLWKSLKGDLTDNIIGFDGIGDVTAEKMVLEPELLEEFLAKDVSRSDKLKLNISLVQLKHIVEEEELLKFESSSPTKDWEVVKAFFESYDFKSMLKDSYWTKFVAAFDHFWAQENT